MMTLLMVLFIVLFEISQVDQKKFAALKDGLATGLGSTTDVVVSGGTSINQTSGVSPAAIDFGSPVTESQTSATAKRAESAAGSAKETLAAAKREAANLAAIEKKINDA